MCYMESFKVFHAFNGALQFLGYFEENVICLKMLVLSIEDRHFSNVFELRLVSLLWFGCLIRVILTECDTNCVAQAEQECLSKQPC